MVENGLTHVASLHAAPEGMRALGYGHKVERSSDPLILSRLPHGFDPVLASLEARASLLAVDLAGLAQGSARMHIPFANEHRGGNGEEALRLHLYFGWHGSAGLDSTGVASPCI